MVGFAATVARLQPQEAVKLVDQLHGVVDEAFHHKDIFIMERTSDGCVAAAGLREAFEEERSTSIVSLADSSYGSEVGLDDSECRPKERTTSKSSRATPPPPAQPPSHYAALLASASLQLLSSSTRVTVPQSSSPQLQLRVALHSGPCSAGVVGLQTTVGVTRVPRYKLFGPTLHFAGALCSSGLALQIRVSKRCRDLLVEAGGFRFERCPDYVATSSGKTVESYWLEGREGLELKLPTLDLAVPLTEYQDIGL